MKHKSPWNVSVMRNKYSKVFRKQTRYTANCHRVRLSLTWSNSADSDMNFSTYLQIPSRFYRRVKSYIKVTQKYISYDQIKHQCNVHSGTDWLGTNVS